MTVFGLQLVAMITMFIDHLGGQFCNNFVVMRCIGRFAFPIYAFLVAEGFRHIKGDPDRVAKHLGGYIFLAVISEFCYDLLECNTFDVVSLIDSQSAVITLLLGFLGLMAIDKWKDTNKLYMWCTIILTAIMNYMVFSNYKFAGVLLIYAFYYYLNRFEGKSYGWRLSRMLLIFICYLPIYHWARYNFCDWAGYIENLIGDNKWWYMTHVFVAALLATYTGKKGYSSKTYKTIYRNFYPAHLFILGVIKHLFIL